jgi:hypothetical protein
MFEAALNRLKEERLAVADAREHILKDEELKASDAAHRRQLLAQTLLELGQLGRAIDLLTRVQAGELVEMDLPEPAEPRAPPPPRQTGLIRRVQPIGGRA